MEHCLREDLNEHAERTMAVLHPVKLVITKTVKVILYVVLILGILAIFVKAMGFGFDRMHEKRKAGLAAAAPKAPKTTLPPMPEPKPEGAPLPADTSAGTLQLIDVTEEEAAVVMAVVSHRSGIPLNRLQFNSIKAVPADGKDET